MTTFFPEDGGQPTIVDGRRLTDENSVAVIYDNPLDNVPDLAHIFFQRCLAAEVSPSSVFLAAGVCLFYPSRAISP